MPITLLSASSSLSREIISHHHCHHSISLPQLHVFWWLTLSFTHLMKKLRLYNILSSIFAGLGWAWEVNETQWAHCSGSWKTCERVYETTELSAQEQAGGHAQCSLLSHPHLEFGEVHFYQPRGDCSQMARMVVYPHMRWLAKLPLAMVSRGSPGRWWKRSFLSWWGASRPVTKMHEQWQSPGLCLFSLVGTKVMCMYEAERTPRDHGCTWKPVPLNAVLKTQ